MVSRDSEKLPFDSGTDSGKTRSPKFPIGHSTTASLGECKTRFLTNHGLLRCRTQIRQDFLNSCINWCNPRYHSRPGLAGREVDV